MKLSAPLVLASASPRRKALLEQLGLEFIVHESNADESISADLSPEEIVEILSHRKARAVADVHLSALTLAADTLVYLNGTILGKPKSDEDAAEQLRLLSGRSHEVLTGFALIHPPTERVAQATQKTTVEFAELSDEEIDAYVSTGLPMDKAGSYGIQDRWGAIFVQNITGDYNTVVGLPLRRFYSTLRTEFPDLIEI